MVRAILIRGLLAGLLAGVVAGLVAYAIGEPLVERAVAFEATLDHIRRRPARSAGSPRRMLASAGRTTNRSSTTASVHMTIPPATHTSPKSPLDGFAARAAAPRNGTGTINHSAQPRDAK